MSDNCPVCLGDYVQGQVAVCCANMHVLCHDCFGATRAAQLNRPQWHGDARGCIICREAFLPLDEHYPYPETLPGPERAVVEAAIAQANMAAIAAAQPPPAPVAPPPPPPALIRFGLVDGRPAARRGQKRSMAELDAAVTATANTAWELAYLTASKDYRREKSKRRVRVWRAKKRGEDGLLEQGAMDVWVLANAAPARFDFAPQPY